MPYLYFLLNNQVFKEFLYSRINPYPDGLFGCKIYCPPILNLGNSNNKLPYTYGLTNVAFTV